MRLIQESLNEIAGTTDLRNQDAINILAGTTDRSQQDAFNIWAGTTGLSRQDAANVKAGTSNLSLQEALDTFATSGGGGITDPTDIANCELWVEGEQGVFSDAGTTPAVDSDPVYQWNDLSGNGRHITQTNASFRPTYNVTPGQINQIIFTSASDQYMNIPDFATGFTEGECFCVLEVNNDPPGVLVDSGLWKIGSEGADADFYPATDGTVQIGWGSNNAKAVGNPTANLTVTHLLNVSSAASDYNVRINGSLEHNTSSNTVGFTATPELGRSLLGAFHLDGRIREYVMYSRVLTSGERTSVTTYLMDKHGIS